MERCDSCEFVYADHVGDDLIENIRLLGPKFRAILVDDAVTLEALHWRSASQEWSAIEYACHVRDVLLVQRERLFLALVEDTPTFVPMYREERARLDSYNTQLPQIIAVQIGVAADLFANACMNLDAASWERTCIYNFPNPTPRTLRWLGAHTLHEGEHHLRDITGCLDARNYSRCAGERGSR